MYICKYVRTYVCMHVCMHACMYVCMRACVNACVCMYIITMYAAKQKLLQCKSVRHIRISKNITKKFDTQLRTGVYHRVTDRKIHIQM